MTKKDKQILLGRLSAISLTVESMGTKIYELRKAQTDLFGDVASMRRQLGSVNTHEDEPYLLEEPDGSVSIDELKEAPDDAT